MSETKLTMAQQVADAVRTFQYQTTGHQPESVTAVMNGGTLVVTMQEALTPAEKALSATAAGATQVQNYHRQLFAHSCNVLLEKIKIITGVVVQEAAAVIEANAGPIIHTFTNGTIIQVFLLTEPLSMEVWNGIGGNQSTLLPES